VTGRRHQIIVELLRHYNDVEDPCRSPDGVRGTGGRVIGMLPEWNTTYRELERCLKLMRNEAPWLWRDVRERFLANTTRRITVQVIRSQKGPRPVLPPNTEEIAPIQLDSKTGVYLVRQWSESVDVERVDAGIRWISDQFRGEPYLPQAIIEAAA